MKRKLTTVLAGAVAATMMMGMAVSADEIAVMVPSADHGWTGAVLSYFIGKTAFGALLN